jgi:nucleoside-diphosphate-sugar epimerase
MFLVTGSALFIGSNIVAPAEGLARLQQHAADVPVLCQALEQCLGLI